MANEFYALMGRMRYITRWGLMRNTFSENIQEHSHQVAVLAHALALIRRDILHLPTPEPDRCAVAALFHDASEILTGDMPTPIKDDKELEPFVKGADKLSAYLKCIEEQKAGNTEFDSAAAMTMQALRDMHREEMDWFLDHCLEPFTRTLDQL